MTDHERDTQDGTDLPSNAAEYGVDAHGATHYHSAVRHEVWVVEDGEIVEHYEDVDSIQTWHDFVADRRGWMETYYSDKSLAELLVETIEEMGVTA